MMIKKEKIASIIVRFFKKNGYTYYKLSGIMEVDQKSIKDWETEKHIIRDSSFHKLLETLKNKFNLEFKEFFDFLEKELNNAGIDRDYIREIIGNNIDISYVVNELMKSPISNLERKKLQDNLGTANIIQILKDFFFQYQDYFQVSEKIIDETEAEMAYSPLIYNSNSDDKNSIKSINYLILKFANNYQVGIVLSNYIIDYSSKEYNYYCYMIEKLKTQNDLKMLLLVTDIDKQMIPFNKQSSLMEKYNLFFEFVKKEDLQKISTHGFKFNRNDIDNFEKLLDRHRYAQLIFERFMPYLSAISNEIIFLPYFKKVCKELDSGSSVRDESILKNILISHSNSEKSNTNNYTIYAKYARKILLNDICRYSYLSRHTIYHERILVANKVKSILEKRGIQKLSLVVEICAPNSLTTCNIIDKCERVLLFTASHTAYSLMTKLQSETGNRFLPSNVSLRLSHLNPEYMMHQYQNDLNGKVDFLVIGYGAGSQINDLIRFIRYAYNWLSENGVLFISVYNKEAIVFNKHHIHDQRFNNFPLYISDYWSYTLDEQTHLLKKLNAYSVENFKSMYLSLFDPNNIEISTYPYLSALVNPGEYSRDILDEIREADKEFTLKGKHGQFIHVTAQKNNLSVKWRWNERIKNYLNKKNIQYKCYVHTVAPDSKSLMRSLQSEKDIDMPNATLLKTVILQKKSRKDCWIYVILPYDNRVSYDHSKYELVPESRVIQKFNQGTISPLTVITKKVKNQTVFLLNSDRIDKKYVIMGGGINSESIRIDTEDFKKIVSSTKIIDEINVKI